ncbi:conserved hypothetical protein [Neospora caninum Liverpool]|uniref:Transmembrane protein n=1 Tax=Neospora caninum (strain Liverpool) TaxID=572307 RepID=F0VRD6_NEOCL|nr:conserved hypothetical protein [Neospora caninum Liverpool]CBZ56284.1 conserved hypothetical protein [Neospora caninum Liverpool]CEL71047.1 TPA: hypothetical protein BN1204_067090 [Neospora caninum Liverpool]|eukprot:XP_003886309.1 conserved hypothetical protein [Neospora caninum Liverpool]
MDLLTPSSAAASPSPTSEQDCPRDVTSGVRTAGTPLETDPPPSSSDSSPVSREHQPLLSPARNGLTDPTYGILGGPENQLRSHVPSNLVPLPPGPADEARAALLLQAGEEGRKEAEALFCQGLPQRDKEEAAIDRLFKGLREVSQETSSAKIIEWFSLFFALAATIAPIILGSVKRFQILDPYYRFLVAAVGGEAFLAYALPAAIVLWNLYANDDEETHSSRAISRDRRALLLVNACRITLGVFFLIVAAFGFQSHQQEEHGHVDLGTVKKTFALRSVCQLGSAFVFAILAVYAWIAARLISCKAMHVVNGWAHFYDSMTLASADSLVAVASKRVKYMEYVGISSAGLLFILAVVDLVGVTRSPKVPAR